MDFDVILDDNGNRDINAEFQRDCKAMGINEEVDELLEDLGIEV